MRRRKTPGDTMIDRSVLTLVSAFGLVFLHGALGLNIYRHPGLAPVALGVSLAALAVLWIRGARAVARGWGDPSARVARFSSLGALALTFFPALMLLVVAVTGGEAEQM